MRLDTRRPLWPFVGILLALFIFSLAAPRAWKGKPRPTRDESALAADATIGPRLITQRRGIVVAHVPSAILPRPAYERLEPVFSASGETVATKPSRNDICATNHAPLAETPLPTPVQQTEVSELAAGPAFPEVSPTEAYSQPLTDEPVFAVALPEDENKEHLDGEFRADEEFMLDMQVEVSEESEYDETITLNEKPELYEQGAPNEQTEIDDPVEIAFPARTATAAKPWNVDLPPLDISRIRRQLIESGRTAARSTSRSVASTIKRAQTLRQQWSALGVAATTPREETSADPSHARSVGDLPSEPEGGPVVIISDANEPTTAPDTTAEYGDRQERSVVREPKPIRLTHPSDRLAMRVARTDDSRGSGGPALESPSGSAKQPETDDGQLTGAVFTRSPSLAESLSQLVDDSYSGMWAGRVLDLLNSLESAPVEDSGTANLVESLAKSAEEANRLALAAPTASLQLHLHRLHFALARRTGLYRAVVAVQHDRRTASEEPAARLRLAAAVAKLKKITDDSQHGAAWREYLLLDELETASHGKADMGRDARLELARGLLNRLVSDDLTDGQRAFLRTTPVIHLKQAIIHWTEGPVDIARLLRRIERYEETGSPAMGHAIEADRLSLDWSNDTGSRKLADALAWHYRNANLRLAVSTEFLNRLIRQPTSVAEPVNDYIAGATVAGQSITSTKVSVGLVPDPRSLRIRLQASGTVGSNTSSTSGPATFRSAGQTQYIAKKLFIISHEGIQSQPAEANATAEKRLRGIRTRFDGIPLFRDVVRSIAINEHDKIHFRALAEIEDRVAKKARQRLDEESTQRVTNVEQRVHDKVLVPLEALALHPETIDLRTTEKRMVVRMRLTGDSQVSAHTPRPRAPSDSAMSVQLHESILNNTAAQLKLDGKTFTLPDLHRSVWKSFGRENVPVPDDLPATAKVTFAKHDAIRIRCQEGRLRISLSIAKVHHRRTTYRNFKVHATYGPRIDRLQIQLARDGVLSIEGSRLRPGAHVALQGVFVKLFSKNRPLSIIPAERNDDPRLKGLMITQFVLDDGWLSIAAGPKQSKRVAQLRR